MFEFISETCSTFTQNGSSENAVTLKNINIKFSGAEQIVKEPVNHDF